MPPVSFCKAAKVHTPAAGYRRSSPAHRAATICASGRIVCSTQRRKHGSGLSRGPRVLIEPCFTIMALSLVSLCSPEAANASSTAIDVTSFLLSHPFWTLAGAGALVLVIPRIIKVRSNNTTLYILLPSCVRCQCVSLPLLLFSFGSVLRCGQKWFTVVLDCCCYFIYGVLFIKSFVYCNTSDSRSIPHLWGALVSYSESEFCKLCQCDARGGTYSTESYTAPVL